ncbi:BRCA1-associated RING domain protein 1 isoform X2 [Neoarius graeffei]|uniref:BRCA1-associated RING domain protein 1 isoform X2 n=1 Tax=Neoarius graeffei TaxID=443677 RepID=UPI00298D4B6A|nr:BRCA1-associated RING domain protein 1 isoform X2 [Neoarius graeffei]
MASDREAESDNGMWVKTREAVTHFRKLLLCSKCSNILKEPVCLGVCEHLLCRSCAAPCVGDGCSVCLSPAWVKDVHINRQISNITQLFLQLEALLCPTQCSAAPAESSTPSTEPGVLTRKKNFKIWFSPKSRKVRCRVENPADSNPPAPKRSDSSVLSVFNFTSSSQDSGSSTPPRTSRSTEQKKKKERKKQKSIVRKPIRGTRSQSKEKKKRLEAANQQWGFGKDDLLEDEENSVNQSEMRSCKRVSFRCPSSSSEQEKEVPQGDKQVLSPIRSQTRSILKDGTEKTPDVMSVSEIQQQPPSSLKRSKPESGSPQSTPKRPRLSPGQRRRRRSGSSPDTSPYSSVPERSMKESPGSSPATGRSQTSPAYMKRNHKGETPLHLAAIKGDVEVTKALLEQGADPNLKDHAGWTPLHEACNLGHVGVVKVLLQQGALINTPGYENDSPLHDAVRNSHAAVARLLLEHGASTTVLNIFGLRPVDYAMTPEMREVLSLVPEALHRETPPMSSPANLSKSQAVMKKDVQATLIGSKLTVAQQNQLTKAAQVLGGKRVETFSSAVTHVVVPDGPLPSTLTVLHGILNGCWIVTFTWLAECLQQGRRIDESEFEAGEGPQRARVNRVSLLPPLFDGCFFYLLGSSHKPPRDELVQLVKAGGGQMLSRQPKADSDVTQTVMVAAYHAQPDSDQALCTHYVLYEPQNSSRPGPVRLGKVWSAPSSWLLDCIRAFSLLPVPEL